MGVVPCFRPLHPFTVFKCGEETVPSVLRGCLSDESSHDVRFLIVLMNYYVTVCITLRRRSEIHFVTVLCIKRYYF